jgi:hypothetical protein
MNRLQPGLVLLGPLLPASIESSREFPQGLAPAAQPEHGDQYPQQNQAQQQDETLDQQNEVDRIDFKH